jgi:pre-mRNA-splicing factor SPF27
LLETYGKNAWLIGNSQLEEELKVLQREVEGVKGQLEVVDEERRRKMEGVKAEMEGLEDGWRRGVRGIVEVELATEGLRREVLERKRAGAGG